MLKKFIAEEGEEDVADVEWGDAGALIHSPGRRKGDRGPKRATVESDSEGEISEVEEDEDVDGGGSAGVGPRRSGRKRKSALRMMAAAGQRGNDANDSDNSEPDLVGNNRGGAFAQEVGGDDRAEVAAELAAGEDDVANEAAAQGL